MSGSRTAYEERIRNTFGKVEFVEADGCEGEFGFITDVMKEGEDEDAAARFDNVIHMIRAAS